MHAAPQADEEVGGDGEEDGGEHTQRDEVREDFGDEVGECAVVAVAALVDVEGPFEPEEGEGTDGLFGEGGREGRIKSETK